MVESRGEATLYSVLQTRELRVSHPALDRSGISAYRDCLSSVRAVRPYLETIMKKSLPVLIVILLFPLLGFAAKSSNNRDDDRALFLTFGSMYGVDGAFVNNDSIRGVKGDELPWEVDSARGTLTTDGHLRISVRGLVFPNDPSVPPELRGINDEPNFRALVSCLSDDGHGGIVTVNVKSQPFHATRQGNSEINARLVLPAQCVAPIVFVIANSAWSAMPSRLNMNGYARTPSAKASALPCVLGIAGSPCFDIRRTSYRPCTMSRGVAT